MSDEEKYFENSKLLGQYLLVMSLIIFLITFFCFLFFYLSCNYCTCCNNYENENEESIEKIDIEIQN